MAVVPKINGGSRGIWKRVLVDAEPGGGRLDGRLA
jgi:hypothetical protein